MINYISLFVYSDEFITMFGFAILVFVAYHWLRLSTSSDEDTSKHAEKGLIVSALLFLFYIAWIYVYASYTQTAFTRIAFTLAESMSNIETLISVGPQQSEPVTFVEQIIGTVQTIGLVVWVLFFMLLSILKSPVLIINWFENLLTE